MTKEELRNIIEQLRNGDELSYNAYSQLIDCVDELEQTDWILCSEKMPEEKENPLMKKAGIKDCAYSDKVLVTAIDMDVLAGKKEPYKGDRVVISDSFQNGKLMHFKYVKMGALAWSPFPKPYKGDKNDT